MCLFTNSILNRLFSSNLSWSQLFVNVKYANFQWMKIERHSTQKNYYKEKFYNTREKSIIKIFENILLNSMISKTVDRKSSKRNIDKSCEQKGSQSNSKSWICGSNFRIDLIINWKQVYQKAIWWDCNIKTVYILFICYLDTAIVFWDNLFLWEQFYC